MMWLPYNVDWAKQMPVCCHQTAGRSKCRARIQLPQIVRQMKQHTKLELIAVCLITFAFTMLIHNCIDTLIMVSIFSLTMILNSGAARDTNLSSIVH